ncbi:response regulator [Candidatus Uhrbacteria bacterium]|nr:response regulator [Candidatus Uhrbacteria bacterium]
MSQFKILVIDRDPFFTQIFQKQFEKEGWETFRALTGEEGLEIVRKEEPDAIVLDMVLPKKSGFDILEALQAKEETKKIPVIVLTQLSTKEDIERCLELGAAEYLIKTHHTPEDVAEHLKKYLGR